MSGNVPPLSTVHLQLWREPPQQTSFLPASTNSWSSQRLYGCHLQEKESQPTHARPPVCSLCKDDAEFCWTCRDMKLTECRQTNYLCCVHYYLPHKLFIADLVWSQMQSPCWAKEKKRPQTVVFRLSGGAQPAVIHTHHGAATNTQIKPALLYPTSQWSSGHLNSTSCQGASQRQQKTKTKAHLGSGEI